MLLICRGGGLKTTSSPRGRVPLELMGASGGGPSLRWHRGCCRPGIAIGDVFLTSPHRRASRLQPPSARRTTSPFPSILHLLRHGDPFPGVLWDAVCADLRRDCHAGAPQPNPRARDPPAPSARTALYRTHVRAAPIRPPRGPGQTHPHVLIPSGLPRAAREASLSTFPPTCRMPPHIACDRHSPPHSRKALHTGGKMVLSLGHLPPPSRRPPPHRHH